MANLQLPQEVIITGHTFSKLRDKHYEIPKNHYFDFVITLLYPDEVLIHSETKKLNFIRVVNAGKFNIVGVRLLSRNILIISTTFNSSKTRYIEKIRSEKTQIFKK